MPEERIDVVAVHRANWPETFDERYLSLVVALHRAHVSESRRSETLIAGYGLSLGELDVLSTLRRSPPPWVLTPSDLRRSLFITSGGLAKILHQLEDRGLVSRLINSADRRVKPVQLTAAAKPVIEAAIADIISSGRARLQATLSDEEIQQATAILSKLADA